MPSWFRLETVEVPQLPSLQVDAPVFRVHLEFLIQRTVERAWLSSPAEWWTFWGATETGMGESFQRVEHCVSQSCWGVAESLGFLFPGDSPRVN